jgi:hypothetical protein
MKTYPCPKCGREGYCRDCCCIHRSHYLPMRYRDCPVCHHSTEDAA